MNFHINHSTGKKHGHKLLAKLYSRKGFKRLHARCSRALKPIWLVRIGWRFVKESLLQSRDRPSFSHERYGLGRCAIIFINLDRRIDRRVEVELELAILGVTSATKRFAAIAEEDGVLGCVKSHHAAVDLVDGSKELVMICEDDVMFRAGREEIDLLVEEFFQKPQLDVLCLAYNSWSKPVKVNGQLSVAHNLETTSCYIFRTEFRDHFRTAFSRGAPRIQNGYPSWAGAADIVWKPLQQWKLVFAIPSKRLAVQRPSFSDIEGKPADYGV